MKGIIICASGVTSRMIAKKIEDKFKEFEIDGKIDAIDTTNAVEILKSNEYDFYLISPQASFKFKEFSKLTKKPISQIKPDNYVPVDSGIKNIIAQIEEII